MNDISPIQQNPASSLSPVAGRPSEKQLLAALAHTDHRVAGFAARIAADLTGPLSLALVKQLLQCIGRDREVYQSFIFVAALYHKLDDAAKLHAALEATRDIYRRTAFDEAEDLASYLWRAIQTSPLTLLQDEWAAVEAAAEPQGIDLSFVTFRKEAAKTSPKDCWAWLQEHLNVGTTSAELDEDEASLDLDRKAGEMMQPLVHSDLLSTPWLLEALETHEFVDTLLEDIVIRILAERADPAAPAALFTRLREALEDGDEFVPDTCLEAMAEHMNDNTLNFAVNRLQELRKKKPTPAEAEEAELLGRFFSLSTHPSIPSLLLPFLAGEADDGIAYEVAGALCYFPDAHVMQQVLDWAKNAGNKERLKDLSQTLLANCDFLKLPVPNRPRWEALAAEYTEDTERFLEEMEEELEEEELARDPFVRAEPKVGRNDLCPCGSGKKYKKCCAG